jgi:hypothetical protein
VFQSYQLFNKKKNSRLVRLARLQWQCGSDVNKQNQLQVQIRNQAAKNVECLDIILIIHVILLFYIINNSLAKYLHRDHRLQNAITYKFDLCTAQDIRKS